MNCCNKQEFDSKFNRKYVARKLVQYRRNGPKKSSRTLIKVIQSFGIDGMTLLDIGGGIGDIQHALINSGVRKATNNEASLAYLEACQTEAERQSHGNIIEHIHGDFVEVEDQIKPADIVTLDRVICCYPDMNRLVYLSVQKAKKIYGLVYPRDGWWSKVALWLFYNLRYWIFRDPFRNYIHPTEAVEALIEKSGLKQAFKQNMGAWQVVVYHRE